MLSPFATTYCVDRYGMIVYIANPIGKDRLVRQWRFVVVQGFARYHQVILADA